MQAMPDKIRFDDAFMQGSGVWLRCSRCGHVYFQENPLMKAGDRFAIRTGQILSEEAYSPRKKARSCRQNPHPSVIGMKTVFILLIKSRRQKKYLNEEINLDIEKTPEESISGENDRS